MKKLLSLLLFLTTPAFAGNTPPPGVPGQIITNFNGAKYGAIGNGIRSVTTGTTDTARTTDGLIQLNTGVSVNETIPAGTINGQPLMINDGSGTAATFPITLTGGGGSTIGGASTLTLSDDFFNITLKWDNSSNWIVTDYYSGSLAGNFLLSDSGSILTTDSGDPLIP